MGLAVGAVAIFPCAAGLCSSYPLHPHRTAAGGRDFKRRRNAEERHAGAGVPREARGRRVGRKELRWARKEKKKEDKEEGRRERRVGF